MASHQQELNLRRLYLMQMNTQYLTRREYDESFLKNDLRNEYCHDRD